MKKLLIAALLLAPWGAFAAQPAADVAVLAYSADELAAKFAGKNRKEIVSAITTIPVYEQTFTSADGTEYEVVRYGKTNQDYRLFLYKFKWPQPLVGVAENAKGVLALNERYQIAIPLTEQDMVRTTSAATLTTVSDVANGRTYNVYQNGNEFLLFSNGVLTNQFDNAQEYAAFMATLTAANSAYTAQQAQEQTALETARLNQQQTSYARPRSYWAPVVGTALVGGLLWGDIYLHHHYRPRHHHVAPAPGPAPRPRPHHRPGHLKPLKPSGPPAGTPRMREVNGKFMHH